MTDQELLLTSRPVNSKKLLSGQGLLLTSRPEVEDNEHKMDAELSGTFFHIPCIHQPNNTKKSDKIYTDNNYKTSKISYF